MYKKISVILFAAILAAVPAASLLAPYRTFSQQENRVLSSFPEFNFENVTSKQFMRGFDDFVSDHIVGRDGWITAKTALTTAAGKRDNRDVYLGKDCLIQNIANPDPAVYKPNTRAVAEFAEKSGKPTFLLLAPTAAEIERGRLPAFATTCDQRSFIVRDIGRNLGQAKLIDVTGTLQSHKDEYIYYRTDHHWTSLGAYYAYAQAANSLGFAPYPLRDFSVEHAGRNFNGTLYSRSGYRSVTPDVLDFYHLKSGDGMTGLVIGKGKNSIQSSSIYFRKWLAQKDKYSAFFNGNHPIETATSQSGNGKKLLVIKDSYAHSLVPFLLNHYSRITLIDLRYLTDPLSKAVDLPDYDQVLFIYNVDTFNTDSSIRSAAD